MQGNNKMTLSPQKTMSMRLEAEYSQLVQQQSSGGAKAPNRPVKAAPQSAATTPVDTVTLSSVQPDGGAAPKLKPSQPVTTAEKSALHAQFSVYA